MEKDKIDIVLKAIDDKLGEDIKVIDIGEKTTIADKFVLASGSSINQTQAIANEIEEKVEKAGYRVFGKEGFREGNWILIDLGDCIVHIFTRDQRDFYSLEKLWD